MQVGDVMKNTVLQKTVYGALACALVFVATMLAVPAPLVGNVNLGDGFLLLCTCLSSSPLTAIACALGAMLSDVVGGYAIYAPATFLIKLLMGLCVIGVGRGLTRMRFPAVPARLIASILAECMMIFGYWGYESVALSYGFLAAAANIPFNAIQGTIGIMLSQILVPILQKTKIMQTDRHSK